MAINVTASPISLTVTQKMGILSHTPGADRNPELDQTLYAGTRISYDDGTDVYPYIPSVTITITGTWFNVSIVADPVTITLSQHGDDAYGELWEAEPIDITFTLYDSDMVTEAIRRNWVKWSNIGSLDFTIGHDNVAGERPMDFKGWIYGLKKLGNKVACYGENGVSFLIPSGNVWGLQSVYRLGLKGQGAFCGTESAHWFVDAEGALWQLSDSLDKLDYVEYLADLSPSLTLTYDEQNQLVYLCDGQYGYVYSPKDRSFGKGYANVSGIGYQGGSLYFAAPSTISTPTLELTTDIFDFGTRRGKTIRNVQLGTDTTKTLYVAIDYRRDKSSDWSTTAWRTVNAEGVAYITCYGHEFRIKVKASAYEYLELDYITINGAIHDY